MKSITLKDVEFIAFSLAKKLMEFDEPIPDYSTRFPHILESCVAMPFMKFDGKYLYQGLIKKAGILFYLMIKNHPFQNGNKRMAITTLLTFLYINNKWLKTDTKNFYNFTRLVAASPPELKDSFVAVIEQYIQKYTSELKN